MRASNVSIKANYLIVMKIVENRSHNNILYKLSLKTNAGHLAVSTHICYASALIFPDPDIINLRHGHMPFIHVIEIHMHRA